ncbi:MAG: trypsin-like peptidase domain-containing protein, partial [Spirochaetes bacterium]|nr:trypsin-like peptidase domain-containing protein [Spirochaetota bacterium]
KIYYIITNYHVIRGVDSIKVTIDQERYYDGETVASDPAVDIAVIKIKTKDDLKVARFGDSDKLSSGDFVIAIGNPFGLQGTMTFGIISALGRGDISTGTVNLTNFIQTDAAINPGNSGGALINIEGEVIGINTLIYSQSGGNIGIGFAIPVNIAKKIADQIIDTGKVEHGYLGIEFEELDKDKIKTLNLGDIKGGMHVLNVLEDSPADKYGLRLGDVLIELNGKKLIKSNDLTLVIGNSKPGAKVRLKILRDGELVEKEIVLSNRDEMKFSKKSKEVEAETFENYGIELTELNKNIRGQYKISSNINGVVIVKIDPRAIASRIGLKEGDVIYNINNNEIKTVDQVKKVLKNNENENYFFINRNGKKFIVKM